MDRSEPCTAPMHEAGWGRADRQTFLLTGEQCGGAIFTFD